MFTAIECGPALSGVYEILYTPEDMTSFLGLHRGYESDSRFTASLSGVCLIGVISTSIRWVPLQ